MYPRPGGSTGRFSDVDDWPLLGCRPRAKPFEAQLVTNGDTQEWLLRDIEESTAHKVAGLLNEGVKQIEIAEELGITRGAVSKATRKAKQSGLIKGQSNG